MASPKRCPVPTPLGIAAAEADRIDAQLTAALARIWRYGEKTARYDWAAAEVRRLRRNLRELLTLVAALRTSDALQPRPQAEGVKDRAATAQRRQRRP